MLLFLLLTIKYANTASSISVTRPGAVPSLPKKSEIEEKMKKK